MAETLALPSRLIDVHNHIAADDSDGDKLIGIMDANNVETTVVMGTAAHKNDIVVSAAAKHPGRLVPGVYLDPRKGPAAIAEMRQYCRQGVRLVKLFPNFGYYPDDDSLKPFFDSVADLGMGVLSHCGWLTPTMGVTAAYYSHPGRFEKLIRTYKDTIFIMAHMGGIAGFLETIMLTTRTPNTYTDCSPGQGVWVLEYAGRMPASIPPEKLMWGLDCYCPQDWLDRQRQALEQLDFAPHAEKIFYSNARGVLEKMGALDPKK